VGEGVGEEDVEPSDALARTRAILTRALGAATAIVAFLASLAAVKFSGATREVHLPLWVLWVVVVFAVALVGITALVGIFMYFNIQRVWGRVSYWRSKANRVSAIEDLAYYDPITGLPSVKGLARDLSNPHENRCLIVLDLQDFGRINKEHNHWKGDEYLRNFSSMISSDSRRNEYIYKRQPTENNAGMTRGSATGDAWTHNDGSGDFYILLRGGVIDGLGYLNRLFSRRKEFDEMAERVLGAPYPFGFRAGVIALGKDELLASATERVSLCLIRTMAPESGYLVDWGRIQGDDRTPDDFEDPRFRAGSVAGNTLTEARRNFKRPQSGDPLTATTKTG
jgi:hypothetical protein